MTTRIVHVQEGQDLIDLVDVTERACEFDGCEVVGEMADMVQDGDEWYCIEHAVGLGIEVVL